MKAKSKIIFVLIAVLLCAVMAAIMSACGDNTQTEQPSTPQKGTYDMSGVVFTDLTVTYDGHEHSIIATNLPEGVIVAYEGNPQINAGIYTITAHFIGDSENYEPIPDKTATLTITKATYDMGGVIFNDSTVTYDGQAHSIMATNLPAGVTVSYEGNGKIEVGTYTVTAHFTGDSQNYEFIPDKTAKLTILPLGLSGINFESRSFVYDGQPKSIYINGNLPEDITVEYEGNAQTNAGIHTVTAKFNAPAKYGTLPDLTATLTITKATYDMSGVVFSDLTVAYDGQAYSITATNLPEGVTATYEGNGQTEVGIHTVTAHFTGDSTNYQPIPDKTAKLTIVAISLTGISFEGKTFVYDGQPKSIYISGDLPEDVIVEYEGNTQTNAGVYTVTAKFNAPAKYGTLPDLTATLTISKATYNMSGVVFNDSTVTYDGQEHSLCITGKLPDGVKVDYDGNGQTEVGTHTVTAKFTGDSTNYQPIPDKTAKLTILPLGLSGISFESKSFVYDGQPKSIYISGNLPEDVTVTYIGNEKTEAGVYTVTAKFTAPDYYNQISNLTATLTITRATHKVTFKQAGQPDVVKEVLDLAGLNPSDIPKPIEENGYSSIVWEDIDLSCITADITVNAIKTPITYSITYYLDGGTNNADNPTSYNIETATITLLSATKTGYAFAGWYSDEQLKTQVTQIARGSYGNIDLYAKFVTPTAGLRYSRYGNEYTVTDYSGTDKDVVIPNIWQGYPVTSIGSSAFSGCTSLVCITIPDSVTSIGYRAFEGCTSLESITIGDSVTSIGGWAFEDCTRLESVTIGNSVTSIGIYAFYNCTRLTSITIPDSVTSIYQGTFKGCTGLTSITIPDSVTSIGYEAFDKCTSLKIVYYGGTAEQWYNIRIDSYNTSLTNATRYYNSSGSGNAGSNTYKTQWESNSLLKLLPFPTFGTCTGITTMTGNAGATFTGATEANFKAYISLISGTFSTNSSLTGNNSYVAYNAAGTIRVAIGYANGNFTVLVTQV